MAKEAIVRCPHCGSTEGLYTKTTYVNVPWRFGFNNEPHINTEMYDNAEKEFAVRQPTAKNATGPSAA